MREIHTIKTALLWFLVAALGGFLLALLGEGI